MDPRMVRNGIMVGGIAVAVAIAFFVGRNSVTPAPQSAEKATPVTPPAAESSTPTAVNMPPVRTAEAPRDDAVRPAAERPAANPPAPDRPIAAARIAAANGAAQANANPIVQSLTPARRHMERARRALAAAAVENHGGFVENARADADAAAASLAKAVTYAQEHPELKDAPPETSAESDAAIQRIKGRTSAGVNNQANMVTALEALQETLDAVQQAGGGGLGGTRDKLIADLDRTATNVAGGLDFGNKAGALP